MSPTAQGVFISHNDKDRARAQRVYERLTADGYGPCYLSSHPEEGITAGVYWQEDLFRGLRRCEAVVFLASRASADSRWCFGELFVARFLDKTIIPVQLEDCRLPALLDGIQVVPGAPIDEGSYARLLRGLDRERDARAKVEGIKALRDFVSKWRRSRRGWLGLRRPRR